MSDEPREQPGQIEIASRRRAPRFRAFLLTGAVIGALVGVLVFLLAPGAPGSTFSGRTVAGFLAMALALFGALVGGAVAVVADRRSTRGVRS